MKCLMLILLATRQIFHANANFNKMFRPMQSELELNLTVCTDRLLYDLTDYTHLAFSYDGLLIDNIAHALKNTRVTNLKLDRPLQRVKVTRELITIVVEEKKDLIRYLGSVFAGADTFVDYFIIYLGNESLEEIFEIIWLNKMTKVIVLDKFNDFYSYRPYEDGCNTIKPRFQSNCLDIKYSELVNIFNYELTTLYDCPVRALALSNPPYVIDVDDESNAGYETKIYQAAATILNFKLNFVEHNFSRWGFKEEGGGNYTHLLAQFQRDLHIDILFGRLPARSRILTDFETTATYYHNLVTFFVPTARPVDPIRNVMNVFNWKVWFLMNISFLTFNLTIYFLKLSNLSKSKHLNYINIVAISVSQFTKPPNGPTLKLLYLTWVVYSFIIAASYSSALISFLTKPAYEKQINSVEEIVNAKLAVGGNIYSDTLVPDGTADFVMCRNVHTAACIFRVAFKRDMALIEDTEVVNYYQYKLKQHSLKALLYMIPSEQHEHYIWAIIRRGHPLGRMMNKLIMYFKQGGFLDRWRRIFDINERKSVAAGFAVITFDHIRLSLYVYLAGILICLLVFIWEMKITFRNILRNYPMYKRVICKLEEI